MESCASELYSLADFAIELTAAETESGCRVRAVELVASVAVSQGRCRFTVETFLATHKLPSTTKGPGVASLHLAKAVAATVTGGE